ncbi:FAD-dependent monooxygenase [Bdellovibrio bacteriovorus]|uniref:FAD-dependent monooxygenase n=1 Tax=Bdellovibrio TaxID=958 RepID=UPI0035A8558B
MNCQKALVIGGGIAGLMAAHVLSEHFQSVIVLEKDASVGVDFPRGGVPQGAHLHVLLKRGQKILKDLMPEIHDDFRACPSIDWAEDTVWENRLGEFPRYPSPVRTRSMSRPLLESRIYSHVKQNPRISFEREEVAEIHIDKKQVGFVRCRSQRILYADLVILAGGQYFPMKRIFSQFPIEKVTEALPIGITYRSMMFSEKSLSFAGFRQYYYQFSPPHDSLGAVISPVEGGRCVATIIEQGARQEATPDFQGFLSLAAKVPGGKFLRIIEKGTPLSGMSFFQKPQMHMRRFHRIKNFPENLLVLGDAFCSLNPVFGQGMTVALEQVRLLKEILGERKIKSSSFHDSSVQRVRLPFLLSKLGSDPRDGVAKRYLNQFTKRCQRSPKLHRRFLKVLHLEGSYGDLFDFYSLMAALFRRSL